MGFSREAAAAELSIRGDDAAGRGAGGAVATYFARSRIFTF